MVKILRVLLLLLFYSYIVSAQSIRVSAYSDTSNYNVGDYINYHIDIVRGKNVKIFVPNFVDSLKGVDFIEQKPTYSEESNNQIVEKYVFVFSKYDSGKVTIPPIKIFYTEGSDTSKKYLVTNSVSFIVHTLPVKQNEDIKDVKAPLKIKLNILLIVTLIIVLLLLLAALFFGYRYYRKRKLSRATATSVVSVPPHEIAISALRSLEDRKLWQQGLIKEYHSEITEIIRRYFEARFGILAMEQPSSELLAELSKIKEAEVIYNKTKEFLTNADMVKFAKFQPMPSINEEMMKQAYEIVKNTIPVSVEENNLVIKNVQ
ncbi:hypothetical protein ABRY23_05130 [Melioribacteraceae bacterium 4301-Me]|uniref:hypothetical protein n=1 Tax=Pyranulibacter aquaticus TaxID=3163344 RepID=UPI003594A551